MCYNFSMKKIALLGALASFSAFAGSPTAIREVEGGWEYDFILGRPTEFNYVTIDEVGSNARTWKLYADGWIFGQGSSIGPACGAHLAKVGTHQAITLFVAGDAKPEIRDLTVSLVPLADGIDPKLLKVRQQDERTVFVDFGRDTAIVGFSYAGGLGAFMDDFDVFSSWNLELETSDINPLNDNYLVRSDDDYEFHNSIRVRYLKLRAKKGVIDAAKLSFKSVPYGWKKHLTSETWEQKLERLAWWTEARFGMFIHFGLYALPARHEWYKTTAAVPEEQYQRYFEHFNPDRFDAREWARAAKQAGMKYVVLTSKHHEGFCLWDSKVTDYKITNTPFGRDLIREYVDALRAEGLKVGFYYSLIDWHHPDFPIDCVHPRREGSFWDPLYDHSKVNANRDMAKYRQYMKDQVTELLSNYGKIDIIWFDFSYPRARNGKGSDDWDSKGLLALARKLQPDIIVDNRLDLPDYEDGWDFATPEQNREPGWVKVHGRKVPWETCQTFSGSWGYYRDEKSWKSNFQVLEQLISTVSKGGNVIMNVGPTGRGEFDYRAKERLAAYGQWLNACGESIYGCTAAPAEFVAPPNTILTYNPKTNRLYLHVLAWQWGQLPISFARRVKYAQLLNDKSEIELRYGALQLPTDKPPVEIPVIEFILK